MSKPELQLPSQALSVNIDYVDTSLSEARDTQQETKILHGFKVDNIGLLLESKMTSELLTSMSICSLPNTNQTLYGMGNLRGNIIPVFDLQNLFGMPECSNKYILAIGEGEDAVAVLLDEPPIQIELQSQDRLNALPPMPKALKAHVNGAYHTNGLWIDCDLMSFFASLHEHIK